MLPQEIRCSEIASEAILGQKYSHTSYLARGVLHLIFSCPRMHLLYKPADLNFPVLLFSEQQVHGVTSLEKESLLFLAIVTYTS